MVPPQPGPFARAVRSCSPEQAYYSRPIALRHPIVFYEGHLPAFSFNTLVKKGLGGPSIDPRLETLFARGIDPDTQSAGASGTSGDRGPIRDVRARVRRRSRRAGDRRACRARSSIGRAIRCSIAPKRCSRILEHEAMHQETLLYMWHRLPFRREAPAGRLRADCRRPRRPSRSGSRSPPGRATLGVDRSDVPFGWDNEFPALCADVPAFSIERHNVTNAQFLEFVDAGGYNDSRVVERRGLAVGRRASASSTRCSGSARRRLVVARDVRHAAAAAVVAGLREPRGGRGVRALARRAPADRSRVPARGIR